MKGFFYLPLVLKLIEMGLTNDSNVLFGAEFDPSAIVKGASEMIASLQGVNVKLKEVQASFDGTTQRMETIQVELKQTATQFNGLDKNAKDYATTAATLKTKMADLEKENLALTATYKKQGEELTSLKKTNDTLVTSLDKVEEQQKKVKDVFNQKLTTNIDISTLNAANQKLAQLKGNFSKTFSPDMLKDIFDTKQLDLLLDHVQQGKGEFEQFTRVVDALTASLVTVEPGTQAFEDLSAAIRAGKGVISEYTKLYAQATEEVEKSEPAYKSIRARLAEYRKELDLLEAAGKEETAEFKEVQIAAARLTDQYGDMQQQIAILASDTKNLDFGVSAAQAAASGFEVVTGALQLFGLSSEDAQAAQTKLLSIMALVQGAQQLQNLLLKEGVIRTVGADLATKAYTASQRILTTTLGATAAASRTLNTVLLASGVGAIIIALGYLVSKIMEWTDATDKAKKVNDELNETLKRQEAYMKEDLEMIDNNTKYREEKIKQRGTNEALLYAAGQEAYKEKIIYYNNQFKLLQSQFDAADAEGRKKVGEEQMKLIDEVMRIKFANNLTQAKEDTRLANEEEKRLKRLRDIRLEYALKANVDFDERKELISMKAENEEKIRELRRAGIETATTQEMYEIKRSEVIEKYNKIRAEKEREYRKEISLIGKVDEEKELINLKFEHDKRLAELRRIDASTTSETNLFNLRRNEIIQKWNKIRLEEERQLNIEVEKLSFEAHDRRIENLQNQLERERAVIGAEAIKSKADLEQRQTDQLNALLEKKNAKLISPAQYDTYVKQVEDIFNSLFESLEDKVTADYKALGGRILQDTIAGMDEALTITGNGISIQASREIAEQADLYLKGVVNYEQYQKAITKINFEENDRRLQATRNTILGEIALVKQRLKGNIDEDEKKRLTKQLSDLQKAYSDASTEQLTNQVNEHKQARDEHAEHLKLVLSTYQNFANQVVSFLNQISQAEEQRLDRSIAFQEKRVANAKELAEKGNAEYLELEQKRMDELVRRREENARKQMAINSALSASQALVAAISAVADASSKGGAIAAIAAGGAILAAIGSLYQFVSSLEAPSAEFFEGTTFVDGKPGKDKVKAKLTRGEAVIPVDRNEAYHTTVKAIYNKTVPADILNTFVNAYPKITVPALDYSRVGMATDIHFNSKSQAETNQKLDKVNDTLALVADKLDKLDNVSVVLNEEGFAISILKAANSEKMKWFN